MKFFKNVFSQMHSFILCLLLSVIFWGWIFTMLTDTDRKYKVTVFVDSYGLEEKDLTLRLEEQKPDGIKMIKVHDFNYDIFGMGDFEKGDVFIARQSTFDELLAENPDCLAIITVPDRFEPYVYEDRVYGIRIFDAETQTGFGNMDYIYYALIGKPESENYYLCFNAASPHLETNAGARDNAAWEVAMEILQLPEKESR